MKQWLSIFSLQVLGVMLSGYLLTWWVVWLIGLLNAFLACGYLLQKGVSFKGARLGLLTLSFIAGYWVGFVWTYLLDVQGGGVLSPKLSMMLAISSQLGGYFISGIFLGILALLGSWTGCELHRLKGST